MACPQAAAPGPVPDTLTSREHHVYVERFIDDDASYLDWVARNPDGFVLNTYRKPTRGYLKLHRATCRTINDRPARGVRWTADYQKICGSRSELERWAREQVHGEPQPCRTCAA